jgi:hypothetical protein
MATSSPAGQHRVEPIGSAILDRCFREPKRKLSPAGMTALTTYQKIGNRHKKTNRNTVADNPADHH